MRTTERALTTLRARTTLLATLLTAAVLVAASVASLAILSRQLTKTDDDVDRARVVDLLDLARTGDVPAVLPSLDDNSVAQVVEDDGTVLAATPNVAGRPSIVVSGPPADRAPVVRTVSGPDDQETETYRLWIASGPTADGTVTVLVGRSLETVGEATSTLRRTLLVGVPILLFTFALTVWWVVGRALARVDALTAAVADIGERDLDRRVPESGTHDEVGRLAVTMNAMLARLQVSRDLQRRFVADASHDLQTPLTAVHTGLEVALAHPDETDVARLAADLLSTTSQLELLVQDLVHLARADSEHPHVDDLLDLDDLVLEEAARLRPGSPVPIDTSGVSAAPVRGDADELRRLVRNVLDNATRHAATRVVVDVVSTPESALLTVLDDGPGVPPDQRELIFGRFYRGDPARGSGRGSGLGLAIARGTAGRHGGTLVVLDGPGGRFRLRLPVAAVGDRQDPPPTAPAGVPLRR